MSEKISEKLKYKFSEKVKSNKLTFNLLTDNIISFILSVLLFIFLNNSGKYIINGYFINTSYLEHKVQEAVEDFKSYISLEEVSIYDYDKIDKWSKDHKYFEIYIFKDNVLIYDSAFRNRDNKYEKIVAESNLAAYFNSISFKDEDADIYLDNYLEYKYYSISIFISGVVSIIFFNLLMLFLVSKKIKYIKTLESEIKILEGGNLNYSITIEGNDELSSLAQSIDEMRKSFIERLENEDNARSANSELITAMSHDLRTPLTSLVGYLDIIEYKKYKTEENLMKYIHNCREKAYQIKSMSDKLFEYFLVFNTKNEMDLERYNGNELLEQLIQEHIFILSNKNFKFNLKHCSEQFFFDINLISIRRVFDNIFSNISKYADNSKPIKINYYIENNSLFIIMENFIKKDLRYVSSSGIGLKTCKKIIEMHKGKLNLLNKDTKFKINIILPICNKCLQSLNE